MRYLQLPALGFIFAVSLIIQPTSSVAITCELENLQDNATSNSSSGYTSHPTYSEHSSSSSFFSSNQARKLSDYNIIVSNSVEGRVHYCKLDGSESFDYFLSESDPIGDINLNIPKSYTISVRSPSYSLRLFDRVLFNEDAEPEVITGTRPIDIIRRTVNEYRDAGVQEGIEQRLDGRTLDLNTLNRIVNELSVYRGSLFERIEIEEEPQAWILTIFGIPDSVPTSNYSFRFSKHSISSHWQEILDSLEQQNILFTWQEKNGRFREITLQEPLPADSNLPAAFLVDMLRAPYTPLLQKQLETFANQLETRVRDGGILLIRDTQWGIFEEDSTYPYSLENRLSNFLDGREDPLIEASLNSNDSSLDEPLQALGEEGANAEGASDSEGNNSGAPYQLPRQRELNIFSVAHENFFGSDILVEQLGYLEIEKYLKSYGYLSFGFYSNLNDENFIPFYRNWKSSRPGGLLIFHSHGERNGAIQVGLFDRFALAEAFVQSLGDINGIFIDSDVRVTEVDSSIHVDHFYSAFPSPELTGLERKRKGAKRFLVMIHRDSFRNLPEKDLMVAANCYGTACLGDAMPTKFFIGKDEVSYVRYGLNFVKTLFSTLTGGSGEEYLPLDKAFEHSVPAYYSVPMIPDGYYHVFERETDTTQCLDPDGNLVVGSTCKMSPGSGNPYRLIRKTPDEKPLVLNPYILSSKWLGDTRVRLNFAVDMQRIFRKEEPISVTYFSRNSIERAWVPKVGESGGPEWKSSNVIEFSIFSKAAEIETTPDIMSFGYVLSGDAVLPTVLIPWFGLHGNIMSEGGLSRYIYQQGIRNFSTSTGGPYFAEDFIGFVVEDHTSSCFKTTHDQRELENLCPY